MFSNWREEALSAMIHSAEYKDLTDQINLKENELFTPKVIKTQHFSGVFTTVQRRMPNPQERQNILFDLKILESKRSVLTNRIPARTVEGFFDWCVLYAERQVAQ